MNDKKRSRLDDWESKLLMIPKYFSVNVHRLLSKQMVKAIAKILIKTAIYSSKEEYKEAAEEYLSEN
ncbi:hypothetical protein C2G38_2189390 [Gigaspora rosea]|uniref:Uncharacterized protein n=1 Tax=Gigaspora rosea TaxID=44941 RepID=A0A397V6U0_9GLOM|nr:hypothetical protein C2G38_2189390 [Gigaspora rosea]